MKKSTDKGVVHFLDIEEFDGADDDKRREMVREMLIAIRRKDTADGDED